MRANSSRRRSSQGAAAAAVSGAVAQRHGRILGFDHVALPMQNTDAMLAFYRGLGCDVTENAWVCSVHFGTVPPPGNARLSPSAPPPPSPLRGFVLCLGRNARVSKGLTRLRWR